MQDSICGQSEDLSSSDDSFCLQLQLASTQVETKIPASQHLITNLAYKLKPNHKKTQYLRARLDTCADVKIMPVSVYKLVCQDPDCKMLAPHSKLQIGTCVTQRICVDNLSALNGHIRHTIVCSLCILYHLNDILSMPYFLFCVQNSPLWQARARLLSTHVPLIVALSFICDLHLV